jgi:SNF2 family DNA or RNA helicase
LIQVHVDDERTQICFQSTSNLASIRELDRLQEILHQQIKSGLAERSSIEVLNVKVAGFLQRHDLLYSHLERYHGNYEFDEEFFELLDWAKVVLGDEPRLAPLSADDALGALERAGWDVDARHPADFQLRNLTALSHHPNAAFFSVPGAGKTVEALAFAHATSAERPPFCLIVAPRNAYGSWEHEIDACFLNDVESSVFRAVGGEEELRDVMFTVSPPRFVLVNYNRLHTRNSFFIGYLRHLEHLGHERVLILDESHHFKGGKSFANSVLQVAFHADRRIVLSGTPMPRHTEDLVPQFQALLPMNIQDIDASTVLDVSRNRFQRTTKNDLGLLSPNISYRAVEMTPTQHEVYQMLTDFYAREANSKGSTRTHAEFSRLGRILVYLLMQVANPTLIQSLVTQGLEPGNLDLRNRIMELNKNQPHQEDPRGPKFTWTAARARQLAAAGHKVLIWTSYVQNVEGLAEELEDLNAVYIHGGVGTDEFAGISTDEIYDTDDESNGEEETREAVIRRFKEDPSCWVLVANPAAAGEGISLHDVCHHAIFLDRNFDATKFMQAIDRIHRYGVNDIGEVICATTPTSIEIVFCPGTIDETVQENLARKQQQMYAWLNDPSLAPALAALNPVVSGEELARIFNPTGRPELEHEA